MILVVGATGLLGGMVTRRLLAEGRQVRALVRQGSASEPLAAAGAELVQGDLKDPRSLRAACADVEAVVTTANSAARGGEDTVETVERAGNAALVDAATAAGVGRFLFVSALGADPASPVPFLQAKAESEHRVRSSGMTWTVYEPNALMDIWVPAVVGAPALAGQPVTLVGEGLRRHSLVAVQDVAAYIAAALDHPAARNETLVVGGPEPVSWQDVVSTVSQALDREVPVRTVGAGEPVPGLTPAMAALLAAMETYDSPIDMSVLSATFEVTPTPLRAFVEQYVAREGVARP